MKNQQLDPSLEKHYSLGKERERLQAAIFEKERTLRILKKEMPSPPALILDVGGAYGVYAFPLAGKGYKVHLIDPIPIHIEQAKEYGKNFPEVELANISLGDARNIEKSNDSVDVVLFFGPLYHLIEKEDRLKALNEAYRVLKPGGILFASVISRFQSYIDMMHKEISCSRMDLIKKELLTGLHFSENSKMHIYFHHPKELKDELRKSRFKSISLRGIEGPVWHQESTQNLQHEEKKWEKLLNLLELIEREEAIIGSSAHIMAIAKK